MSLFDKIKQEAYWQRKFDIWEAIKDTSIIAELEQQFNGQYKIISHMVR